MLFSIIDPICSEFCNHKKLLEQLECGVKIFCWLFFLSDLREEMKKERSEQKQKPHTIMERTKKSSSSEGMFIIIYSCTIYEIAVQSSPIYNNN